MSMMSLTFSNLKTRDVQARKGQSKMLYMRRLTPTFWRVLGPGLIFAFLCVLECVCVWGGCSCACGLQIISFLQRKPTAYIFNCTSNSDFKDVNLFDQHLCLIFIALNCQVGNTLKEYHSPSILMACLDMHICNRIIANNSSPQLQFYNQDLVLGNSVLIQINTFYF